MISSLFKFFPQHLLLAFFSSDDFEIKIKEHSVTDYFISIVTARDITVLGNTVCIENGLWVALLSHIVYCINPHKTLQALHFPSECICAFVFMLLHFLKLLHSNFRHPYAWKRNYSAPIKNERREVWGFSETGALVRLKTRLKRITFNVSANHICYGVCRGSEIHVRTAVTTGVIPHPSRNISLLQQLQTVTQFCTTLKDSHRVQERHFH